MDWRKVIDHMRARALVYRTTGRGMSQPEPPLDNTAWRVLAGIADALEAGLEEE